MTTVLVESLESIDPLQDVWRSTDGKHWTLQTAKAPWPARKWFGATVDSSGTLFVMGGMLGESGLNDVWRSTTQGVTWTPISLALPWSARHSFAMVRLPNGTRPDRFYIMGGNDGLEQHDVWKSDDSGSSWELMRFTHVREMTYTDIETRASWSPRSAPAVADSKGRVTLVGGRANSTGGFSREVWLLDSPPGDEAHWYSGSDQELRNQIEHDPLQWQKDSEALFTQRRGHVVIVDADGIVFVIGGQDQEALRRDIWSKEMSMDVLNLQIRLTEFYVEQQRRIEQEARDRQRQIEEQQKKLEEEQKKLEETQGER